MPAKFCTRQQVNEIHNNNNDNVEIVNNNNNNNDNDNRNSSRKKRPRLISKSIGGITLTVNQRHRIYNSVKRQRLIVKNANIVVNLSDRKLSLIESAVLNKGLNFCVTSDNKRRMNETVDTEIKAFTRTLQIKYMFDDDSDETYEKFTGNPKWQPPSCKCSPSINGYSEFLQEEIKKLISTNNIKHNISKKERNALNSLRRDKSILIQKADKGGSIVIVNTVDYKNKIENMLSDPITYSHVLNINLIEAKLQTDNIFLHLFANGYISKPQKNCLMRCKPKMPILYGLPKIHKNNWPLRPIVSQINSPAYNLNKYLDYLLTTAEKSIPNLLQDTTKFLQIVSTLGPMPDDIILFTVDVTSLYTVLPHDLVIDYVEEFYTETLVDWQKYTPDIPPIPGCLIKEMIKIILGQTFFSFNDKIYTQNYGITMGAPSSVKLANISLYKHLNKILRNYPKMMPFLQLRLIDDIFGIWSGTEEELLDWVKFYSNAHVSIKFTLDFSRIEIPFLDTLVYIENNTIRTKLYKKPTDNKQYLHFNSEHPQHVKKAIPYAQALRYRRIIEDDVIFNLELEKLKNNFLMRQYPISVLNNAIDRVSTLDRSDVIEYKIKTATVWNYIPFVLTFSNLLVSNRKSNVYKLLSESWTELLLSSPGLNTLNEPKIVFRKSNTINSLLVSTVFPPPRWLAQQHGRRALPSLILLEPTVLGQCKPCGVPRCKTCRIICVSDVFCSTHFDKSFRLKEDLNCSSSNVVYLITCLKCKIQYVGETVRPLRERINNHRSCINVNRDTPIGIHFNSIDHNRSDLQVIPIEKVKTNSINERRAREYFWQLTLGTIFPKGLNGFPVENRVLFESLNICNAMDLELFWTLKQLEFNSDEGD